VLAYAWEPVTSKLHVDEPGVMVPGDVLPSPQLTVAEYSSAVQPGSESVKVATRAVNAVLGTCGVSVYPLPKRAASATDAPPFSAVVLPVEVWIVTVVP
jgi:hypothetical protein